MIPPQRYPGPLDAQLCGAVKIDRPLEAVAAHIGREPGTDLGRLSDQHSGDGEEVVLEISIGIPRPVFPKAGGNEHPTRVRRVGGPDPREIERAHRLATD